MSVAELLDEQLVRVRRFKERARWDAIDEASAPAADTIGLLLTQFRRLSALAPWPAFCPAAAGEVAAREKELGGLVEAWDAIPESDLTPRSVTQLQRQATEVSTRTVQALSASESAARTAVRARARRVADGRFLQEVLEIEAHEIDEARAAVERLLGVVGALVDRREQPPDGAPEEWPGAWSKFVSLTTPAELLRRRELPEELAGLIEALLARGDVPLDELDEEQLLGLRRSKALARLCRLQLERGETTR